MLRFHHQSSPGFAIGRTAHLLRLVVRRALEEVGADLSTEEAQLVVALSDVDRRLRIGDFADVAMRDATTLTRQLDRLVEKGLVRREASEEDRRQMLVSLTADGRKRLRQVLPVLDEVRRSALAEIPESDIETTIRTLERMQRNLVSIKDAI